MVHDSMWLQEFVIRKQATTIMRHETKKTTGAACHQLCKSVDEIRLLLGDLPTT